MAVIAVVVVIAIATAVVILVVVISTFVVNSVSTQYIIDEYHKALVVLFIFRQVD